MGLGSDLRRQILMEDITMGLFEWQERGGYYMTLAQINQLANLLVDRTLLALERHAAAINQ